MPMCFVNANIGARVVAVLGVVTSGAVIAQLATELARGRGRGRAAMLLGLSLDELDSRQRQALHTNHHDLHDHIHHVFAPPDDLPAFDAYVRDVLIGFLSFACVYWAASVLLAYSSLKTSRWAALPWLLLQSLSIASQVARLVVQVAQYQHFLSDPDHHSLYSHPMSPHPNHAHSDAELRLEEHVREHEQEHDVEVEHSAVVGIAVAVVYLAMSACEWLVVLLAHRDWRDSKRSCRARGGPGDEGWSLSMTDIRTKEILSTAPPPSHV